MHLLSFTSLTRVLIKQPPIYCFGSGFSCFKEILADDFCSSHEVLTIVRIYIGRTSPSGHESTNRLLGMHLRLNRTLLPSG